MTTVRVAPGTAVATPQAARDEVRKIRTANGGRLPPGGICVKFADGTYVLDAPLVLDAQDGGTEQEPVVWCAEHRGKAIFTGGRAVTCWRPVTEECYARRLNYPFWLYQGGQRLPCARYPNAVADPLQLKDSFIFTTGTLGGTRNDNALGERSVTGIISCDSPHLAVWAKEPDLWAYGTFLHEYADMKMAVTNIDVGRKALALDNRWYPRGFTHGRRPFYVFNAFSELDQPGEWVLDRVHRRIYVWPHADVRTYPPSIGMTPYLLTATNLMSTTFDGFSLEQPRRDAFLFENCRQVHLRGSTVRLTGAWGVTVRGGGNVVVEGCDLTDLGEGGIRLEGGERDRLVPARHRADNNHIRHYGQVIPSYRPGVSLAGVGNAATHNLIHHTLHQGIWFNGNNHHIAWNVIHDTCLFNDDAGAIYCCQRDWTKRGTVIEHNLVYATGKKPFATNDDAIYLDDFSSGALVRNNIIVGCTRGLHIGGGNGNTAVSNLFVGCESAIHLGSRRSASFGNVHEKGKASYLYAPLARDREQLTSGVWEEAYPDIKRLLAIPDIYRAHDPIFSTIRDNVLVASGPFGGKTEYRHLKVTGITLQDIAFAKNWKESPWRTNREDPRDQPGENDPPYGVLDGGTVAANHVRQTVQRVVLKQGVPVIVTFDARAFEPGKHGDRF